MKNIKKVAIITVAVLVLLFIGLFTGTKYGANSSWTNEIVTQAGSQLNQAGMNKKDQLAKQDLTGQMKTVLDPKIAEEQAELERLLEEYYRMKVEGLTDSPEFKKVEADIEKIRQNAYNRFTKEIDTLFAK